VRVMLGLCESYVRIVLCWSFGLFRSYAAVTFWCHVAFTVELRWTFFEVIVELLSSYLGLT